MRAARKDQKGAKAPPKGAAVKNTKIEIDQTGTQRPREAPTSSGQTKSGRQVTKRKHSKEYQEPGDEEQEETVEPPKKKFKSTSGKEQLEKLETDRSEPSANAGRTRSSRTRNQSYRPPPDEVEKPNDDNQLSSSAAAMKRPRKKARK